MEKYLADVAFIAFNEVMLPINGIQKLEVVVLNDTDYAICINDYKIIRREKGKDRITTELIAKLMFLCITGEIARSETREVVYLENIFEKVANDLEERGY